MDIKETVKSAIKQLMGNKGRTVLTMMGMFIGVGAVIMILALGNGITSFVTGSFSDMGVGVFQINVKENKIENLITQEDMEMIRSLPEVESLAAANGSDGIVYNEKGEQFKGSINGFEPIYVNEISKLDILAGRNLTQKDEQAYGRSVVIADAVAKALFNTGTDYQKAVGQMIDITVNEQPNTFEVIGVYDTEVASNLSQKELEQEISSNAFYIPYSTLDQLLGLAGQIQIVVGNVGEDYDASSVTTKIGQILNKRHRIKDGYSIQTIVQYMQMIETVMSTVTLFISAIAGISFIVGGVGIMNIMLVTVKERTKEIGIRKALGASNGVILKQFLIEALMLTVIAGVIGMLIGYVGAILIGGAINIKAEFTVGMLLFTTIASVCIGLIFGVYPAYQAARLDPIEALRAD